MTSSTEDTGIKPTKEDIEDYAIIGRSLLRQTNKDIETLERAIGVLNGQIWLAQDDEAYRAALLEISARLAHIIRQIEEGKARDIQEVNQKIEDVMKTNGLVKSGILYAQ